MGGCYSNEKHEGPEYSNIFGPRASRGEVHKSQIENTPVPTQTLSWEELYINKQALSFLDLFNSEDFKFKNVLLTSYYGEKFLELHDKSFCFELVGRKLVGSANSETEFVFSLDAAVAPSPLLPANLTDQTQLADSQTEFPSVSPNPGPHRPPIPEMQPLTGFGPKSNTAVIGGGLAGVRHHYAHVGVTIIAEAEEYERSTNAKAVPGPNNNLDNVAINAYLENFTSAKFRENLQARYQEILAIRKDSHNFEAGSAALLVFRDPLAVSASLRYSDTSEPVGIKFPTKIYPGLVSPPFLSAAIALVSNKRSLSEQFTTYSLWADRNKKIPLCISGEWCQYPSGDKIAICQENKLPMLSLTGKGEYWAYFLESAYLRSLSDLRLELKVQNLAYCLKDCIGCPIQEVNYKAMKMTQDKLQILLSEIQTYGFPTAFIKSGVWSDSQQGEITQGVPWILNGEVRIPADLASTSQLELVYFGFSLPWKRKVTSNKFEKYSSNTRKISDHFRNNQKEPPLMSDIFMTLPEIFAAFDTYVTCHHMESFKFVPVKLEKPPTPYAFLEIDVTEPSRIYIMMSQPEHLLRHESMSSLENAIESRSLNAPTGKIALKGYSFMGFALFKKDKTTKQVTLIENFGLSARDIWSKQDLTPGNYFLMVRL